MLSCEWKAENEHIMKTFRFSLSKNVNIRKPDERPDFGKASYGSDCCGGFSPRFPQLQAAITL